MRRSVGWMTSIAALVLVVGCGTEPSEVRRAREVLAERRAENPEYQMYALSIMAGSTAPHAKSITLEAVAGESRQAAAEAIKGLGATIDEDTRAALRVAFGRRGAIKAQAAAVLAGQGDSEAVEWLASQLGQGGYVLPADGMAALAASEHEDDVRIALRALIWSKDLSTRNEGYAILGTLDRPWAVDLLLEGLDKEFGEERVGPITALGRTGDPAAGKTVRRWVKTQGLVLASLEALGNLGDAESLAAVEEQLDHEQPLVQAYGAVAAWRLGGSEKATPVIESLLAAEETSVRAALAAQLGAVDAQEATDWLLRLAGDTETDVRVEAYRSLIGRRGSDVTEQFARGSQDDNYGVASVALAGLADSGDPTRSEALAPLLDADNPYLAISAAHAMLSLAAPGQA